MSSENFVPYASSGLVKEPSIVSINYTNQDFWSMKSRLIDFIQQRFGPTGTELPNTFNDLVESSIAIMLIENWAFLADTLSFKMDQIVNELFIDTVTEVENAFRLARLVGFQPQPPIASSSMWTGTLNAVYSTNIVIPTPVSIDVLVGGTPITIELFASTSNNEPIFNQDIVIPAGSRVNSSVIGLEGTTLRASFTGTGDISQTLTLPSSSVLYDSIQVELNGEIWSRVDSFTDSQPRKEYRVEFDSAYTGYVIFGNNRSGLIPPAGSSITATYRVGGGTIGNIITGYVEVQKLGATAGISTGIPITFKNYTRGKYGYDGDNIEDVRKKLPLWVKTQDRCVSGSDYKNLIDQFATPYHGQIGKSTALLRSYGCSGNVIDIYILTKDGENLIKSSDELKMDLTNMLNSKKMLTDYVCIKDGIILYVDVTVDLVLDRAYRKFESEIRAEVLQRLNNFFSLNNWEYGETLKETDLVKEISDMKQISNFSCMFNSSDQEGTTITAKLNEIIRPGNVSLSLMFS
jgi:hypothetical protein